MKMRGPVEKRRESSSTTSRHETHEKLINQTVLSEFKRIIFGYNTMQAVQVLRKIYDDYQKSTPSRLKIIDAYMVYILLTGIAQFVYCFMLNFPFNSFSCLRIQVNEENKSEFSHISPERAFADFIFAHVVLHLVVANFLG
ncbi:DAD family protein [Ostertagia ostertagi]